ncbi:ABC transporter substrate-binding protein [Pseudonocardia nantongensis]|uniref:ABC transporter substrate-binding protein n=1 Tax=Pseudonocardia nantongensis TaxID=1181885 RepID=UPI00397A2177
MPLRRSLPAGLLLALLLLTACTSAPEDPGPAPAGGGPFPVTVEHAYGSTTIPAAPTRVVALGVSDADPLLALGVTPVGLSAFSSYEQTGGLGPWARDRVQGEPPVVLTGDPNPERIASLRPDLIVAVSAGLDQPTYDVLSRIAPVVARPAGTIAFGVPLAEQTRTIATALGRAEEGEQLVAQAEAAFAQARAEHPEFAGRTGTAVLPFDGRYGAFTDADARGRFMTSLGFTLPAGVAEIETGGSFYAELSSERLGVLDGDVLVMLADQPALRAAVDADPVLQQVPVVADGRMVITDADTTGAMSYNTVLSVPYALERLVPQLSAAVQKAPPGN